MRATFSLGMAFAHVRATYRRVILSALAVALGVALVVAVLMMNAGVLASFTETIDDLAGRSHLTISATDDASFPEDPLLESIRAVAGVKLAIPLVSSVAFPDDGSGELLTVFGVDLANDAHVRTYYARGETTDVIPDFLEFLSQPDSIVLSQDYAAAHALHFGDTLGLVTPHGSKTFTVRGLLDPQGLARTLGGRLVIMDLFAAQRAFLGDGRVSQIDVILSDPATVDTVKTTLGHLLPAGMTVQEPLVRKAMLRRTIQGVQAILTVIALLCVVAGFLICYSRLSAVFEARTWEIGLLRAVGVSRSGVAIELLKEALLLGAMGSAVGIPTGLVVAKRALPFVAATVTATYRLPLLAAVPERPARAIALGALVGMVATLLGALGPSVRLARKQPIAALTMRGRSAPLPWRASWYVAGVLLAMTGTVLALQLVTKVATFGQVATLLMAITTCTVGPPFVRLCSGLARNVLPLGTSGHLALEQIAQNPRRSGLAVASLALGVAIVLFLGLFAYSFEATVVSLFSDSLRADLVVSSPFQLASYRSAPLGGELVQGIGRIPGVLAVSGEQSKDQQHDGDAVVLKSFDAPAFTMPSLYGWPLQVGALPDALDRVAHGDAVLITRAFAFQTRKRPGDTLQLVSPSGIHTFLVAGIATGQMENAVILSRDLYRTSWNDGDVYVIHVAVDPEIGTAASVQRAIEQTYGQKYRLTVRTGRDLVTHLRSEAHQAFRVFYVLDLVILILVVIAIGDTLATAVIERTREFGLLRAVGMSKLSIAGGVVAEGIALAAFGLVLALMGGLSMGAFWVTYQLPTMLGWGVDLHIPLPFVVGTLGLAVLLSVLGALLPSVHAARFSVAQALRYE
jgi:putative ABC transport system permease protein